MKTILALSGSNSSISINHYLVTYAASCITQHKVEFVDLTDYPMPIYGEDEEKKGFPDTAITLKETISKADALLISVNEHNGSISAFFKNILDWLSRVDYSFLEGKKIILMSTSPGKRGAVTALEYTKSVLPRYGATIVDSFSLPSFQENFSIEDKKITNQTLALVLQEVLSTFEASL